jgi:hypothetical protein
MGVKLPIPETLKVETPAALILVNPWGEIREPWGKIREPWGEIREPLGKITTSWGLTKRTLSRRAILQSLALYPLGYVSSLLSLLPLIVADWALPVVQSGSSLRE